MFYGDLGTDYSHFNGFLWEINVRKTNFSPYEHFLGTNYVRELRYHCTSGKCYEIDGKSGSK